MGREISLFADYHSHENSLTNYCGLVLKLLYEENPKSFEEVLASLLSDEVNLSVGPSFAQQTKTERSIPDLGIHQSSFSIFFETKLDDWFYSDQLERHVKGFGDKSHVNILFALSNFEMDDLQNRFAKDIATARSHNVIFEAITFEDFVGALEKANSSIQFKSILADFVGYLDRSGRLPKWKYLLDVVNCGATLDEIQRGAYMCPDTGGPYAHRRARYFGPYSGKKVNMIYEIRAVVGIDQNLGEGKVKWKNVKDSDADLVEDALKILKGSAQWRIDENSKHPTQIFLLNEGNATDFVKDSSGGMQQSKKYFWDIASVLQAHNSAELAYKLNGRRWSEFR
jgi:hypothetical protein